MYLLTSVVLNLWALTPSGIEWSFHSGRLDPLENIDIYIMILNSSKITVMKYDENNFKVGGGHCNMKNCVKES